MGGNIHAFKIVLHAIFTTVILQLLHYIVIIAQSLCSLATFTNF